MSEQLVERGQRVTPVELFFDLVFVFAFTQVTTVLSDDPTWGGLGRVPGRSACRPPPPEMGGHARRRPSLTP
ncbi:MAG TPA: low temperature requirement protein A [Gaiellaceae bacterium]